MNLLLDTHAILWWFAGSRLLTPAAREAIADRTNQKLVSAASAWEIATKHRIGRLSGAAELALNIPAHLARQGFVELAVTVEDGARAGALPGPHRDPFDRMLIAQALGDNLVVVSNEIVFDRYGVRRLW